ncbi:MAG TPA: ribosome small subunit-dependent GTPase A [Gemmatimonadales bacterium]|nr:ribosome small subunit-dependent GTPase A [Gemmatimonadales bacterium]
MSDAPLAGTLLERDGAVYRVATPAGEVRAVLRGKLKQERRPETKLIVGDHVRLEPGEGGELHGIVAVEPRTTVLERRNPEHRGARPVVANVDQVLVVAATRDPDPVPQLLDRLLVLAEANDLPAGVVLNKIDLDAGDGLAERMRRAGYAVFRTCAKTGRGVDELRAALAGRTSVVTGPSGAGKSSLLNAIQPGLTLRTGEISRKVRRGTQTTVSARMEPLAAGGFIVDTPGFSEVGLWGIDPAALAQCFPEMRPLHGECRYQDCRHMQEPGCAIRAAVAAGAIAEDRYQSYRMLLEELERAPAEWE